MTDDARPQTTSEHGEPVGFLGLGQMGLPMAQNLARAGYDVRAWNRSAKEVGDVGITLAEDVAAIGRECPVVLAIFDDLGPLEERLPALTGEGSVLRTLVVMSTSSPVRVRELAEQLSQEGVDLVDAPVSGGVPGAEDGTLSIMVGGQDDAVARVRPLLEVMGGRVFHLGGVGAGELTKACNQLVVAATMTALSEAVLLAESNGLDVRQVLEALRAGLGASAVMEWKHYQLTTNDFSPSGQARFIVKDTSFALDAARSAGVSLPETSLVHELFTELTDAGRGGEDIAVVLDHLRTRQA